MLEMLVGVVFTLQTTPGMQLHLQIQGDTVQIGNVETKHPQLSAQQFIPIAHDKEAPPCGIAQEGMVIYRARYHADSQTGALLVCTFEGGLGKYMWHALD